MLSLGTCRNFNCWCCRCW